MWAGLYGTMPLVFEGQSWWPWTSLLIPRSSFISVSSNACSVLYKMPGRAVSDRSLLHTVSPSFNTLPVHRAERHGGGNRSKTSHIWRLSSKEKQRAFFNCKLSQTERMSLHSAWKRRNKANSKAAWNSSTQVLLSFRFMYFCLTANLSHSMKSQNPAGQSAAHFTLRNNPRPKGITKLARERGYCPHLAHGELQQGLC